METGFEEIARGIALVLKDWEPQLEDLSTDVITKRKNSQSRNIKQILGHLIDSASNNHQRMVRLQYNKELVFPDYRQDNDLWIAIQNYKESDWNNLIQLWKFYNLHIIQVIEQVNLNCLNNFWTDFEGTKVTLKDMIEGYLGHLHLHIEEIRELIAKDPTLDFSK